MAKNNWTRASVGLATFGFINLLLFIVLSSPVTTIFDMIDQEGQDMGVDSDVTPLINAFRTVFGLMFIFSMVGLIIWFFLGAHEEEYEEY